VIIGHAEMMREELAAGTPMRKSAEQIVTSSERGAELVKQILAFSRQSKQKQKPVNLSTIIKDSLRLLRSILPSIIEIRQEPDQFDLIISDLTMPHMTGFQLAEKIKQIKPDAPIILCSGFNSTTTKQQIKNAGVSDFVTKPLNKNELAQVVRKVLDSK
jgi:CheY-like chemotaxis protein